MSRDSYAIDTVAILRYLVGSLSPKAEKIFQLAEEEEIDLVFPSITIAELIYTIYKEKEIVGSKINREHLEVIVTTLLTTPNFRVVDLNNAGWFKFLDLDIPELHDRMIVATSLQEKVKALLTNDPEIENSGVIDTIW